MKTVYYGASSLNGFIADQSNSLEWLFQFDGGAGAPDFESFIRDVGAIAMGSTTYMWLYDHLLKKEKPEAWPYKIPSWVFTTRHLPLFPEADVRFVKGDVRPVYEEMKAVANGKNIWLVGGGELVGQFYDQGYLNEIVLNIAPVTLSGGAPLLPRTMHPPMKLKAVLDRSPFVELHYEVPAPKL
nr:dihydrofolate reductase family protein [Bdellovibrio sp. CKG001]BFD62908.1 dihydrofolate reductase family protein [Bdellovibrio sp. HM001]